MGLLNKGNVSLFLFCGILWAKVSIKSVIKLIIDISASHFKYWTTL